MYVLETIPLIGLPRNAPQIFTYYSKALVKKGSLIVIPYRSSDCVAIVLRCNNLKSFKLRLKKEAQYKLRSIKPSTKRSILAADEIVWAMADFISGFYISPLSKSLIQVIPSNNSDLLKQLVLNRSITNKKIVKSESTILYKIDDLYKLLDKEIRDTRNFILILVPEIIGLNAVSNHLASNGIETIEYYGTLSKTFSDAIKLRVNSGRPAIVVGTRQALSLPFKKLAKIILIDPGSVSYYSEREPRFNAAILARYTARLYGSHFIEAYWGLKFNPITQSVDGGDNLNKISIIDMVQEIKNGMRGLFSDSMQSAIFAKPGDDNKIIVQVHHKGLFRLRQCVRCGQIQFCKNCSTPVAVISIGEESKLTIQCKSCNEKMAINEKCKNCSAKQYKNTQPGFEKVYFDLKKLVSYANWEAKIILYDNIKSSKSRIKLWNEFANADGLAILVGTSAVLSKVYSSKVNTFCFLNIDNMLVYPDYNITEKVIRSVYKASSMAERVLIQTYHVHHPFLEALDSQNLKKYLNKEYTDRKKALFPPYGILVKIDISNKDRRLALQLLNQVRDSLNRILTADDDLGQSNPAYLERQRGMFRFSLIVRLKSMMSDPVRDYLLSLPTAFKVWINPPSIL